MFEVMNHNPHRGFEERDLTSEKASECSSSLKWQDYHRKADELWHTLLFLTT